MLARAERSMGRGEGEGYAKEKAWYADSAVGTLLADLFEGKWSPELLAQLAQIPLAEAERGAFPGCPPSSGRKRRFRLVERVQAHKEACSFLLARPPAPVSNRFCGCLRMGKSLGTGNDVGAGLEPHEHLAPGGDQSRPPPRPSKPSGSGLAGTERRWGEAVPASLP